MHRDLGDPGQLVERHHVADHEHLGMAGQREVGERARCGRRGRPRRRSPPRAAPRVATPARPRPTPRRARRSCSVPSLVWTSTPDASTLVTRAPIMSSTPTLRSSRAAACREPVAEGRQRFLPAVDEQHAHRRRDRTSGTRRAGSRDASSRICPAISTPVGPAPTTTIVSHSCFSARVGATSAISNAPKIRRFSSSASSMRLHARREDGELVVPEVRLAGAGGHDQAVVGHLERHVGNPDRVDHAAVEVEAR